MNNQYLEQRRNRRKQFLRIRLGILQLIYKPILSIFLIPIVALTIFMWINMDNIFTLFEVPKIIIPIYESTMFISAILLPILLSLAVIDKIGNMTARKDEADLQESFNNVELRNGCPILMDKKYVKGSNVTIREFYSSIPLKTWNERQHEIMDSMNISYIEKLRYGGKSNGKRIVMYSVKGREINVRENLYDDEF